MWFLEILKFRGLLHGQLLLYALDPKLAVGVIYDYVTMSSISGVFLPCAGFHMYPRLNYRWGNTLLEFLVVAFVFALNLFYRHRQWL